MVTKKNDWHIFKGDNDPRKETPEIPPPPPWRKFQDKDECQEQEEVAERYWEDVKEKAFNRARDRQKGETFRIRKDQKTVVDAVNAALYLRRPLLITGNPGSGKTSLAYAIAYELKLGPVLLWPITARSTLADGLYRYDAIARLQDAQLVKERQETNPEMLEAIDPYRHIGDYIQLGPLGTAFLPAPFPRVLLIDEIDKSDINLPNELLNLLEEGEFEIPEVARLAKREAKLRQESPPIINKIPVRTADDLEFSLSGGKVRCIEFPLIVMTSNGERDFPPAFLRRCLQIEMPKPRHEDLKEIVKAHLESELTLEITTLIEDFAETTHKDAAKYATDQLLNAVHMAIHDADINGLKDILLQALTSVGSNR